MPPIPALIERLRGELRITQSALAQRLKVSAMSVSRWERGVQEPSSQIYVRLGLLASDDLRWQFWELAGLAREHVLDSAASHLPGVNHVHIPLLDARLGASLTNDFVTEAVPIEILSAPAYWTPHARNTFCAFVEGDSMEPVIRDGSIACFDTAQRDPEQLAGELVVAQHQEKGTKLAWIERDPEGFHFRSQDPKVPLIPLTPEWKLIGKLLWWLTRT